MQPSQPSARLIRWSHGALLLAILALTFRSAQAQAGSNGPATPDFAAIDRYVEAQMGEQRIPGLALGIVKGDQIVHLRGFGVASPDGTPMTARTPLSIGSLTKSFTAVAIMQLVEAGRLELEAPVQRYLPWFQIADPVASARITLRQLLSHSSGLPRTLDTEYENRPDEGADTLERRLRSLAPMALEQAPGTYGYSNAGYQVLAMVLQQVTGQSYEEYVGEHIFAALGMGQSFTALNAANEHGMATGHHYWFGVPVASGLPGYRVGPGNGGLFSSAEDMGRYLIAHLNEGRLGDASILSPEGLAALHQPVVTQAPAPGWYALGWGVQATAGITTLAHSGQSYNYLAKMLLVPEEEWGVVVLQNAQYTVRFLSGDLNQDQIADGVMGMLRGRPLPAPYSRSRFFLIYTGFGLLVLGQVLGIWRTATMVRRWSRQPARRPQRWTQKLGRIGLPVALNLAWAATTLIGIPLAVGQEVAYQIPDLSATLLASGVLALVSALIRVVGIVGRGRRAARVEIGSAAI